MSISGNTYNTLQSVLEHSPAFATNEALHAFFIREELVAWQNLLPQTGTVQERVTQVMAMLAERYNHRYENALVLMLEALSQATHRGDALYKAYSQLAAELARILGKPAGNQASLQIVADIEPRRGLIVPISMGKPPTPAERAVDHHTPALTHCWLIVGPGEGAQSSRANAWRIQEKLKPPIHVYTIDIVNFNDVEAVFLAVRNIVQVAREHHGLRPGDIVADYTGGTKTVSVALALVAQVTGIGLQFMQPTAFLRDGSAYRPEDSIARQVNMPFINISSAADDRH